MAKTRFTVNDDGMLEDRDGRILGRLCGITVELADDTVIERAAPPAEPGGNGRGVAVHQQQGKEEQLPPLPPPDEVRIVWDRYVELFNATQQTLSPERRRMIAKALKVRTLEQVLKALEGLRVSPFHNGENDDRRKWLDIRFALKGNSKTGETAEERIDKMIELAGTHGARGYVSPSSLPEGVNPQKVKDRMELIRRNISSDGAFEPARTQAAIEELVEWGLTVEKLDAAPWARLVQ